MIAQMPVDFEESPAFIINQNCLVIVTILQYLTEAGGPCVSMADYRLYCLDRFEKIHLAEWIQAIGDEEAVAMADELRPDAHKCELWEKNRLVARLNPDGRLERIDPAT